MDGVLVIDKPEGLTSHDVVARVRRILGTRRVGHTGTLDPFATGVMVVLVGRATRLAPYIDKDEKEYDALICFGFETDTGDRTGTVTVRADEQQELTAGEIEAQLGRFRGEIEQVPPMYSAKKVAGRKLYEHARRGETVERKPVLVEISELEITDARGLAAAPQVLPVRVVCSAGTYIRVLAEEIGRAVGTRAHLMELRRTRSGRFGLQRSITLAELEDLPDPASALLPAEAAVAHLSRYKLPPDRVTPTTHGLSTTIPFVGFDDGEPVCMTTLSDELLAVGAYNAATRELKPRVVLV